MDKKKCLNKINDKVDDFKRYFISWVKTFSAGLTLFCLLGLFFLPFASQNQSFVQYFLRQFTLAMIFSIFAASWDFLTGISGQISFGHAIFFGIAGYITAFLIKFQNLPIFISILIGAVGTMFFGLIIGIPCLRLRGPYLALGTLAFSLILLKMFLLGSLSDIFFGSEGISALPRLSSSPINEFFIVFFTMIISFIALFQISSSNFGTILKSIRDDEMGSEASGINITKYKIYAFMISALFAGIAGAFYALYTTSVNPTGNLGTVNSFFAILMASLGGLASISGSALGAFFFVFLEYFLIELGFQNYVFLIFGIILMLVVRFAKDGVLQPVKEHLKDLWDLLAGK